MSAARRAVRRALGAARAWAGEPASPPLASHLVALEFPTDPRPRWGYDLPSHPELAALVDAGRERYAETLRSFLGYADHLARIDLDERDPAQPNWNNGWFQGLDAVALYCLLAAERPARYIEVGSGNSTRFARRAIDDHDLPTTITSIDPQPRAEVDGLCDRVVRSALEAADPAVIGELAAGDLLFIDGSHYSFQNSDVTVLFCEVVPRLPPGVLVHVHDVFLPWDYPEQLAPRHYNEQYLLSSWLLAGSRFEIVLPDFWITTQPELHGILAPLWSKLLWSATPVNGTGFWMRTR